MSASSSSAATAAATSTGGAQQDATQQPKNNNQTMRDASHAWEAVDGSSMWTDVQEDADGNILTNYSQLSLAAQIRQRRHRLAATDLARSSKRLVRHMLRHVYLVLDCSQWSREKDPALPPARMRLETTLNLASEYINEYYDQNPLGHLGIVLCKDGEAEMLTALGGSPKKHKLALGAALVTEMSKGGGSSVGGEFSLQNGIEVAGRSLGYAPRYGSREIIVITSALATCDPGDILAETLPRLLHSGIRVSTISLQAELHICTKLAEATGGLSGVCMDTRHLRDLVMGHAIPPPINSFESGAGGDSTPQMICEFVTMGFPSREGGDVPTLVHSTGGGTNDNAFAINPAAADDRRSNRLISFARTGYVCPRCRSRCSDLPSDCAVCGLRLILAPHLARTFHHLFPVRPFMELEEAEVVGSADIATSKEPDMNGENANGKNGLEALPVQSSSAFTPSSAISSSNVASFVVSSSTSSMDDQVNSSATKVISIGPSLIGNSADCDRCCFGCLRIIGCRPVNNASQQQSNGSSNRETAKEQTTEAILRFQCPECRNVFCPDCDAFLHETLHNCPGCLSN
jgi:transcription initiation factor TFIIH subunit 2